MKHTNFIQIFTTAKDKKQAKKIVKFLHKQKLIACSQIIGPIDSTFIWNKKLEETKEFLCVLKTKSNNFKRIEKEIKKVHSYDIPEIISFKIINGNLDYLNWINKEVV